jgi:hypothetical protein
MISLIFFLVAGLGFLAAFLLLGVKGQPVASPGITAVTAMAQMVRLGGPSFKNSTRLLDDSEYRTLLSNPTLRPIAKQLRSERRDLLLQWISVLQSDLNSLWRFRRLLVRHGVRVRASEEFRILQTFVVCWSCLKLLKFSIWFTGPFAVPRLARHAGVMVGGMSDSVAGLLSRAPAATWPEIERSWTTQTA